MECWRHSGKGLAEFVGLTFLIFMDGIGGGTITLSGKGRVVNFGGLNGLACMSVAIFLDRENESISETFSILEYAMNDNIMRAFEFADGIKGEVPSLMILDDVLGPKIRNLVACSTNEVTFINNGGPQIWMVVGLDI